MSENRTPMGFIQRIRNLSLQARIIFAVTTIVSVSILLLSVYIAIRTNQTQSLLSDRLAKAVNQQAQQLITDTVKVEANRANQVLHSAAQDIGPLAQYMGNLFSYDELFNAGQHWSAQNKLIRQPGGFWDNPNTDLASVLLPSHSPLDGAMIAELNTAMFLDFIVPQLLKNNPNYLSVYYMSARDATIYYPNIDLANIVGDYSPLNSPFYTVATPENDPLRIPVWTTPYQDPALTGLIVTNAMPVYDSESRFRGVIAIDVKLSTISTQVGQLSIGKTGYAFLIDSLGRIITLPEKGYADFGLQVEEVPVGEEIKQSIFDAGETDLTAITRDMAAGRNGVQTVTIHGTEHFFGYAAVPETQYSLGIVVPTNELNEVLINTQTELVDQTQQTTTFGLIISLGLLILASVLAIQVSRQLLFPLGILTATAKQIALGNLNARAEIFTRDELGTLGETFNDMASQLQETLTSLEQRITERTAELTERGEELSAQSLELQQANLRNEHRANQFQAIAEVTRTIVQVQSLREILPRITQYISERFGFYHVGIFLVDESKEYANLAAANSEGGQRMLARKHRLKVGQTGIVGNAAGTNKPRIALDTGKDATYFDNPDLPNTRSEMALPLTKGNEVIGVLDIQSTEPAAFTEEDIEILGVLADQVSIAIQNAQLYEESQKSLTEIDTIYRQYLRREWKGYSQQAKLRGYRYSLTGATPIEGEITEADQGSDTGGVAMPINLRNEQIGTINISAPRGRKWSQDELDLIRAVADRVAFSAENARLFEDATTRAERERAVSDITSKIRSTNDPEEMIRTAIHELQQALNVKQIRIVPYTPPTQSTDPQ